MAAAPGAGARAGPGSAAAAPAQAPSTGHAAGAGRRRSRPRRRTWRSPTSPSWRCRRPCACRGTRAPSASRTASGGRSAQGDFGDLVEDFFGFDSGAVDRLRVPLRPVQRHAGRRPPHHRPHDIQFLRQYDVTEPARRLPGRHRRSSAASRAPTTSGQLLAGPRRAAVARVRRPRARSTPSRSG